MRLLLVWLVVAVVAGWVHGPVFGAGGFGLGLVPVRVAGKRGV